MHKVFLTGNVGQDPVVKTFDNGGKVANLSVADTKKGYKTKSGNDIPDHTEWFRCVAKQEGLCNTIEQYVKKGMRITVMGELFTREYEKDGQKASITELIVEKMELPPKGQSDNQPASQASAPKEDDLPW